MSLGNLIHKHVETANKMWAKLANKLITGPCIFFYVWRRCVQLWCPLMCCRPWRSCSAGQMLCAPPGIQPTPPRTSWLSALARSCRWSSCTRTNCAVSNFVTVSSHFKASEKRVSAAHTRFASITKGTGVVLWNFSMVSVQHSWGAEATERITHVFFWPS